MFQLGDSCWAKTTAERVTPSRRTVLTGAASAAASSVAGPSLLEAGADGETVTNGFDARDGGRDSASVSLRSVLDPTPCQTA
jgi:hypothetical protein